jgi:hypothetical protein
MSKNPEFKERPEERPTDMWHRLIAREAELMSEAIREAVAADHARRAGNHRRA